MILSRETRALIDALEDAVERDVLVGTIKHEAKRLQARIALETRIKSLEVKLKRSKKRCKQLSKHTAAVAAAEEETIDPRLEICEGNGFSTHTTRFPKLITKSRISCSTDCRFPSDTYLLESSDAESHPPQPEREETSESHANHP